MSLPQKKRKTVEVKTAPELKEFLIEFLVISVIAGYLVTSYLAFFFRHRIQDSVSQTAQQLSINFPQVESFVENISPDHMPRMRTGKLRKLYDLYIKVMEKDQKLISLTFQGTMTGTNGDSVIINDRPTVTGESIEGVRIVGITNQTLILEYKDETVRLSVGETVSVSLD